MKYSLQITTYKNNSIFNIENYIGTYDEILNKLSKYIPSKPKNYKTLIKELKTYSKKVETNTSGTYFEVREIIKKEK